MSRGHFAEEFETVVGLMPRHYPNGWARWRRCQPGRLFLRRSSRKAARTRRRCPIFRRWILRGARRERGVRSIFLVDIRGDLLPSLSIQRISAMNKMPKRHVLPQHLDARATSLPCSPRRQAHSMAANHGSTVAPASNYTSRAGLMRTHFPQPIMADDCYLILSVAISWRQLMSLQVRDRHVASTSSR